MKAHGFGHLVDKFKEQKKTMDLKPSLSNTDFNQLGLTRVGAGHRFRNAIKKEYDEVNSNVNTVEQNMN